MLVMQDMVNNGAYSWLRHTALPTLGIYPKRTWSLDGILADRDSHII